MPSSKRVSEIDTDSLIKENLLLSHRIKEDIPPKDGCYGVYIIFLIHGIAVLMPWNMFITANDYFVNYKLAPYNVNISSSSNVSTVYQPSMYQNYFLAFLGLVANIPTVLLNGMNAFCNIKRGNIGTRIVCSIIVVVLMFILTVVLAMIDSTTWPDKFFWITMVTVVIINMANGIYQNSIYGLAASLPMKYTNAVVIGSNISGTLASLISIISILLGPDPRTSAIYYFTTAIVILVVAFDTYFALGILPFYNYYERKVNKKVDSSYTKSSLLKVFSKCWVQHLGVFLLFFVTLTCFPAIQASIKPLQLNQYIEDKYFNPVMCFLLFSVFALLGNVLSSFIHLPGPRWVLIPIILRFGFIPFFAFCNFSPHDRRLPVYIDNDYIYLSGAILMAFTSGYLSSLTMMYAPKCVSAPSDQGTAAMLAAFFLVLGIFSGVLFSMPTMYFIRNFDWVPLAVDLTTIAPNLTTFV